MIPLCRVYAIRWMASGVRYCATVGKWDRFIHSHTFFVVFLLFSHVFPSVDDNCTSNRIWTGGHLVPWIRDGLLMLRLSLFISRNIYYLLLVDEKGLSTIMVISWFEWNFAKFLKWIIFWIQEFSLSPSQGEQFGVNRNKNKVTIPHEAIALHAHRTHTSTSCHFGEHEKLACTSTRKPIVWCATYNRCSFIPFSVFHF